MPALSLLLFQLIGDKLSTVDVHLLSSKRMYILFGRLFGILVNEHIDNNANVVTSHKYACHVQCGLL